MVMNKSIQLFAFITLCLLNEDIQQGVVLCTKPLRLKLLRIDYMVYIKY